MRLHRVLMPQDGHTLNREWAAAQNNPSIYYPADVPYFDTPAGVKAYIQHSQATYKYLYDLQVSEAAKQGLLWIASGIFNAGENQEYLTLEYQGENRVANKRYYLPVPPYDMQAPVSQPLTSVGNLVNELERTGYGNNQWVRIETIPEKTVPDFTPLEKPWLFNNPFSSMRMSDGHISVAIVAEGVIFPYWAKNEAWIALENLEPVHFEEVIPQVLEENMPGTSHPEEMEAEKLEDEFADALPIEVREPARVETDPLKIDLDKEEPIEAQKIEVASTEAEKIDPGFFELETIKTDRLETQLLDADRIETEPLAAEQFETQEIEVEKLEAQIKTDPMAVTIADVMRTTAWLAKRTADYLWRKWKGVFK